MAQTIIFKKTTDEVPKLLEAHIQSGNLSFLVGSGASRPAIALAGTIENEINELLEAGNIPEANSKALQFLEELDDVNKDVIAEIASTEIDETLDAYSKFLATLDHLLFERKNLLLPRQANIFTTNYDFFFERAANGLSTVFLNDGFDRTSSSKNGFPFSPEKFSDRIFRSGNVYGRHAEVPSINLIKMHGSLTWSKSADKDIRFSAAEHTALSDGDKAEADKVQEWLLKRAVILPNIRKFESTVLERVYFDLLRLYSNALERENALLLVFGFSFDDEHILDITKRALRNPTAKVVIFAYSAASIAAYAGKFEQQRNVIIVGPADGESITFSDLNELLSKIATVTAITS